MSIIFLDIIFFLSTTILLLFIKSKNKITIYSIFLILFSIVLLIITISFSFFNYFIEFKSLSFLTFYNNLSILKSNNINQSNNSVLFQFFSNIEFQLTKFSGFFILILSVIIFSIGLYLPYYLSNHHIGLHKLNFHLFNFTILILSILLLFLARNMLLFLILWEIMGISSFFCIFFDGEKKKTINAAIQYIIVMHISFLFLLIGTILLYNLTNSFSFDSIKEFFLNDLSADSIKIKTILYYFFTLGFIIKLGIFPFHFWLPEAHPASPSHISSFMSSIVIKTGLFGLIVILNIFGQPSKVFSGFLIFSGLISSFIGIINATIQNQIKKFLAYSSVENAGILLFFYGSAIFGLINNCFFLYLSSFLAIFIYLLNHAFSKCSAFLSAGIVINEMGHENLDYLGGMVHYTKNVSFANFLSSISLSALPPFGNFVGELLVLMGYCNYLVNYRFSIMPFVAFLALGLIGAITLLAFTKFFTTGFLGNFRKNEKKEKIKLSRITIFSLFIPLILALILIYPYFYKFYLTFIKDFSEYLLDRSNEYILDAEMILINNTFKSFYPVIIIFIISSIVFYFIYRSTRVKKSISWVCGYIAKKDDDFQYSSTSFIEPFLAIFKSIAGIKIKKRKDERLFNNNTFLEFEHQDIVDKKILRPIIEKLNILFDKVAIMQSGKTQHYILYGLIFLVIIILITILRYI